MRFIALAAVVLGLLACSDDGAPATVEEDGGGIPKAADAGTKPLPDSPQPPVPEGPGPAPSKVCAQNKDAMGFFTLKSSKSDYVVRLPVGYSVANPTPYPMLVAVHGCGDSAANFAAWGATTYKSRPTQTYIAISIGGRDGACWEPTTDEALVQAAIDDVRQCFFVHQRKIALAGYSSGGLLAYQIALKNAERYAGVLAEHTAIPNRDALIAGARRKLPVAATGGKSDAVFPPAGYRADWAALRAAGFPLEAQEFDATHDGSSEEWDGFLLPNFSTWVK
jgi:pimeloyl-ACP methyl ester carboxylesterase